MSEDPNAADGGHEPLSARQAEVVQAVRAALSGQSYQRAILIGGDGSAFTNELAAALAEPRDPGGDAIVIQLRATALRAPTNPARTHDRPHSTDPARTHDRPHSTDHASDGDTERAPGLAQDADIVIDHHDPRWPVIRHMNPRLTYPAGARLRETACR